jgi:hypothetical protein
MNHKKIYQLARELSKDTAQGESNFHLNNYHKAWQQVEAELSEEEYQRYNHIAKEWTEKKLPKDMQKW